MKLTTKSRYGVRLLFELALHYKKGPLLLNEISKRQKISHKYLSKIIIPLKSNNFVNSIRGMNGGYMLAESPDKIKLDKVVSALEGSLNLTDCLNKGYDCFSQETCPTRDLWYNLSTVIVDFLHSISLQDLIDDYNSKLNNANMFYI